MPRRGRGRKVRYAVVTGYGRMTYQGARKQITEISCHAKGVRHLSPEARTIVDVGGQDTKVIRLNDQGGVENFVMNDKCAAGTGRFLEVMARVLDCPIQSLAQLARAGEAPVSISNLCTVFAESEVISHLAAGVSQANVAAGAIHSIATRIVGMAGRVGVEPQVVMTGGGALNGRWWMPQSVPSPIGQVWEPQVMGRWGPPCSPGSCPKAGRAGHCLKPFRHGSKKSKWSKPGRQHICCRPWLFLPLEKDDVSRTDGQPFP